MKTSSSENVKCLSFNDLLVQKRRSGKFGGSGYILGSPGSGVSTISKQQIVSILQNSDESVIVVDTKGQYVPLAKRFGGEIVEIGRAMEPENQVYINPFDINMGDCVCWDPVILKSEFVAAWLGASFGGTDGFSAQETSLIDRCVNKVYELYINSLDPETLLYDAKLLPTMIDFHRILQAQVGFDAFLLSENLNIFGNGSLNMFLKQTNTVSNNRFVVYDLGQCDPDIFHLCVMAIVEHIWTHCIAVNNNRWPRKVQWLFIDDFCSLLTHNASAEYLRSLYKACRPRGYIFTGVTRDVPAFLSADSEQGFLGCSDYIHLLPVGPEERKYFKEYLNLSAPQVQFFENARIGQSLVYQFESLTEVHGFNNIKTYRFENGWVENLEEEG